MTIETIDGVRVMKLRDKAGQDAKVQDMLTMARLFALISGGHALRDLTVGARRVL